MEVSCCEIRFINVDLPEFIAPKMPAQSRDSTFMSIVGGRDGAEWVAPMFVRRRGCPAYARDQLAACFGGIPQTVPTALFIIVRFMLVLMRLCRGAAQLPGKQLEIPRKNQSMCFDFLSIFGFQPMGALEQEIKLGAVVTVKVKS
jgi:hypothetical protein